MQNKVFRLLICVVLLTCSSIGMQAQEINATVAIEHRQIQGTNVSVFETLKGALTEFINNRKWTDDEYLPNERIDCNFLFNLTGNEGSSYSGTLTITVRRPVYNASLNTTILNLVDKNLKFTYNEFDQLVFNRNSLTQDLTADIAFYVYTILGIDADTFKEYGGDPYYNIAMAIVNTAQSSNVLSSDGWDRLKDKQNRNVLISELTSADFRPFRSYLYLYHMKGLDVMWEDAEKGGNVILDGLSMLEKVNTDVPASYAMLLFFDVKNIEIQSIIANLEIDEDRKKNIVNTLKKIDPSHLKVYDRL